MPCNRWNATSRARWGGGAGDACAARACPEVTRHRARHTEDRLQAPVHQPALRCREAAEARIQRPHAVMDGFLLDQDAGLRLQQLLAGRGTSALERPCSGPTADRVYGAYETGLRIASPAPECGYQGTDVHHPLCVQSEEVASRPGQRPAATFALRRPGVSLRSLGALPLRTAPDARECAPGSVPAAAVSAPVVTRPCAAAPGGSRRRAVSCSRQAGSGGVRSLAPR
jgi:hypothetical protein